jgi:hypothetical protein
MAKPMPRRRALRLLGGAIGAVAVPGFATTKGARAGSRFHRCVPEGGVLCECNCKGEVCQRICCFPKEEYKCKCGTVAEGAGCECRRPCGSGSVCCKSSQYCASAKHALCCNVGLGFGKEEACVGKNSAQCCKPGFKCCGEACCHSLTQVCDEDGGCTCKRGNTKVCGGDCCNPKTQKCCPGSISEKHCAPKDSVCCGPKWCAKTQKCCKGPLVGSTKGATCAPKSFECCGANGYDEAKQKCCGRGLVCPKALTCCDNDCCDPGDVCTPEGCKAPSPASVFRSRSAAARPHAPARAR